jgi:nucleoside-diphosphate-sugar epimerase
MSNRVFITGASGFIGRALARYYREQGSQVCGIDFQADDDWGVIAGDLAQPESWSHLLQGVDLVIHTAAIVSNTAALDLIWRVNVQGTADLLEACCAAGVSRFVQLSSVAAFGFDFAETVDESMPLRPMGNTYVDTKIASEHIVLAYHASGRMECTIIRPGDVYGPGSRPWVIIPLELMSSGRFPLPAHGLGVFSPVYIDDLVRGISLAAEQPEGRGEIFTISGEGGISCEEFFGYHAAMAGRPRALLRMSTGLAVFLAEAGRRLLQLFGRQTELGRGTMDMLSRKAGYSIEKARALIGYQPEISVEEGMRRTREWAENAGLVA